MLEFPEVVAIAAEMRESLVGKTVQAVLPPTKEHKFCWFAGDPAAYSARMRGARISGAEGFGSYAQFSLDNGLLFSFHDGVNARLLPRADAPKDYQLLIEFTDGSALAFTVAMYGGILLHDETFDNPYYQKGRAAVSPLSGAFGALFRQVFEESKPSLSAKAFLATQQRFPGIGNGVLQDILLNAGVHPKRKTGTLDAAEREKLLNATVETLRVMTARGGRDTEKDLYGNPGGYRTMLSKNTLPFGCPICGGPIVKEAYMGGAVYYCPACQPLD